MWEVSCPFPILVCPMKKFVWSFWLISDVKHCFFLLQVFENGRLSHFVDGRGGSGNWMSFVKCARFPDEQNLIAVQVQGQIFYETCKEIRPGQELLVWYGDCYMQFLGIPLTLKDPREDNTVIPPAEGQNLNLLFTPCFSLFTVLNIFVSLFFLHRLRWGLQVWQMREGVCIQVLQRQTSQVHALRGPGRQEVPLSPLQQILREERQIKDPHLTRSRETQASQGTETVHAIPTPQTIMASLHRCTSQWSGKSLCGAERTAPHSGFRFWWGKNSRRASSLQWGHRLNQTEDTLR